MRSIGVALLLVAACGDNGAAPVLPEVTSAAAWVDPRIGTGGIAFAHGSCFVGPAAPHGLAKPGPDTSGPEYGTVNFQHYSGYFAGDDAIRGFSSLHLHGTGATDYGVLSLMPTLAFDASKPTVEAYETRFAKADERVEAGLYAVTLENAIGVELTASTHVAVHRYTMPSAGTILVDLARTLDEGENVDIQASVDTVAHEITGQLHHLGGMSSGYGGYTLHFVIRFSGWTDASAFATGATVQVPAGTTTAAIGLSFVSAEGARANLDAEAPDLDFDRVRDATVAAWDDVLGVVKLTGGTEAQRRTFYTSLYHTFLMPTTIADVDGSYVLSNGTTGVASDYRMLSDLSLWDTYRTVSPLHAWLAPASARDTARSLVEMGDRLGYFPKWPVAIGDSGTMLGASAEIAIADAVARGITGTGADTAWPALRAAAMDTVEPAGGRGGRSDVVPYMELGYVPSSVGRSVSMTVEYAHDDVALAQLAGALGHDADRDALIARSHGWRMLYDPSVGFLRARSADGAFSTADFDPELWMDDYAEADAWQSLVEPGIHDPDGFAELLGGRAAAVDKLTEMFERAKADWETSDESAAHFARKFYWAGNETDLNAPFLFAQLGRPDLTQTWVRWIVDAIYNDTPAGVPGNDDGGTMGAWYVLATLGVYPVAGTDGWILGVPRFPSARIVVGGHELVIDAEGEGAYVQSVQLDGVDLTSPLVTHAQLTAARTLHFVLGDAPSTWAQ